MSFFCYSSLPKAALVAALNFSVFKKIILLIFFVFPMTLRPIAEKKRRNIQLVPTNSRPPSFVSQQKILFGIIAVRDSEKAHIYIS